jgi:methylenetetrahydrofolate dehydrogenase (NADP+)/methenyltetrahydrofolate cyclohydrolase
VTAQIIDGRKIAEKLKADVAEEIGLLRAEGASCCLATIGVGDDYAAKAYQRRLRRISDELEVTCNQIALPESTTQDELLAVVDHLNRDPAVNGILLLRPLPRHIEEAEVFAALSPVKDIEALHPQNAGLLALGVPRYVPSTAASVFHVLDTWVDETGEERDAFYQRSRIVVVGRSNNVGKPAVSLAYERRAAVLSIEEWTSRDNRLGSHTRRADVLIVATGVPGLIRAEHVRSGAVVLDVGINPIRDRDSGVIRMVGDVAFEEVAARARAITPVPGGIGPVTDVWLLRNTATAVRNQQMGDLR